MSVKLGKLTQCNVLNRSIAGLEEARDMLMDAGLINASVYDYQKIEKQFIYLEIEDYETYKQISKKYTKMWWANLKPINNINNYADPLDYIWNEVFHIKDDK